MTDGDGAIPAGRTLSPPAEPPGSALRTLGGRRSNARPDPTDARVGGDRGTPGDRGVADLRPHAVPAPEHPAVPEDSGDPRASVASEPHDDAGRVTEED